MENKNYIPIVEALVFSSEQPLSAEKIAKTLEIEEELARDALDMLKEIYDRDNNRGIEITELSGGFFFRTKMSYAPYIKRIVFGRDAQLSKAVLEVLSIIAYKQPITRAEIEHLRGVDSTNAVRSLLDKRFVRIVGRKDVPGRPHVYGTTKEFLKVFGLRDLAELPNLKEIRDMEREKEIQMRLLGDEHERPAQSAPQEVTEGTAGEEKPAEEKASEDGNIDTTSENNS